MAAKEIAWSGLWYDRHGPRDWRSELPVHALTYLVVPLLVAMLDVRGDDLLARFWEHYQYAFVVTAAVAGLFEVQYRMLWPHLIRRRPSWPVRIAGQAVAIAIGVVPGTFLAAAALEALWGFPADDVRESLWPMVTTVSIVVIGVQVIVDEMAARALASERKAAQARIAAVQAELATLQARTDPHFLFNTLNTVAALIPEDPAVAERMLERLADVFRYAIDAGRRPTVALADELGAVSAYLDVEATRLGDRLSWRIDCEPGLERTALPPLALQPLAENAVRHGAQRRRGRTAIVVSARRDGDAVVLAVEDQPLGDGGPPIGAARPGSGTALADLAARIALAFGEHGDVAFGPAPPAGWRATITVPAEPAS